MTAKATDNQHPEQELRRDRRFQVSQAAIITQPGYTEIACEIRDFCLGGLFLKFTHPEAAIAALAKRADAEVEIVLTPAAVDASQTSPYTRLKSMKDYLKIDHALVRELGTSMIDKALVRSILETGNFLGIKTVAGFVADVEALFKLSEMGVDCVQGTLIGEPPAIGAFGMRRLGHTPRQSFSMFASAQNPVWPSPMIG